MTVKQIEQKQAKDAIKFEAAKKMRAILDQAKKEYGEGWEDDGIEDEISGMVFNEE